jgi:hypothetical protein
MKRKLLFIVKIFLVTIAGTIATRALAQNTSPAGSCANYIQKLSDASITLGQAYGRRQVYDALRPAKADHGFAAPGTEDWVVRKRVSAESDIIKALAAAKALGQPPAACGFERKVVTVPAIDIGTDEGIYASYMGYADFLAKVRPSEKALDGTSAIERFRQLALKDYSPKSTAAKRAVFEADLAKLRKGFADR